MSRLKSTSSGLIESAMNMSTCRRLVSLLVLFTVSSTVPSNKDMYVSLMLVARSELSLMMDKSAWARLIMTTGDTSSSKLAIVPLLS